MPKSVFKSSWSSHTNFYNLFELRSKLHLIYTSLKPFKIHKSFIYFFLQFFLVKKLGHLSYKISCPLGFSDWILMVSFNYVSLLSLLPVSQQLALETWPEFFIGGSVDLLQESLVGLFYLGMIMTTDGNSLFHFFIKCWKMVPF